MNWMDRIANRLDLPAREKGQVLEELADHFDQQRQRLLADGMTEAEAEAETERILGSPREVAATLQSVHSRASWRSALLSAAPFLLYALLPLMHPAWGIRLGAARTWAYTTLAVIVIISAAALMATAGVIMLCVALREIKHGRCHLWGATWLAAGAALPTLALLALDNWVLACGLHVSDHAWHMWNDWIFPVAVLFYASMSLAAAVVSAAGIRSRIGRTAMLVALIPVASYLATASVSALLVAVACLLILISIVGARVFAHPAYGNTSHYSLFSFSVIVSVCLSVFAADTSSANQLLLLGLTLLAACVSCIVFARCSDWRFKKLALVPGILIVSLLAAFAAGGFRTTDLWSGVNIAEQCALIALVIVFGIPAIYSLITTNSHPAMADHPVRAE